MLPMSVSLSGWMLRTRCLSSTPAAPPVNPRCGAGLLPRRLRRSPPPPANDRCPVAYPRAQGVLHTVAGYMLYTSSTFKYVFDHRHDDVYWCTADIGWITGHSYITYGPLANGATSVLVSWNEIFLLLLHLESQLQLCALLTSLKVFLSTPTSAGFGRLLRSTR